METVWDFLTDVFVEILGFVYDATEIASGIDWFDGGAGVGDSPIEGILFLVVLIGGFYLFREDENLAGYPEEHTKLIVKRLNRLGIGVVILFFTWVILLQVIKILVGDN